MVQSRWAVLLCKFKDDTTEPYGRQRYEELFTSSGIGKSNMVDFFRDMSHGQLDLSGSRVFGWYTLDKNRSDYLAGVLPTMTEEQAAIAINEARHTLIQWARDAAAADLTAHGPFFSVVICMNVPTDLFGGADGVVCDDDRWPTAVGGGDLVSTGMSSLSPSLLGQEMGHAYGLSHSRAYGSTEDYMDAWDVMSTANRFMAPHPSFTDVDARGRPVFRVGPGLNAANMSSRGWLDESRVWNATTDTQVNTTVQLRPLHRRDLPGFLAIRFQGYFVEFRTNTGWDAAITPAVLVHTFSATPFEGSHSYLVSDSDGQQAFGVGSFIGTPDSMSFLGSNTRIEVTDIDLGQEIATVRLVHTPADVPQYLEEDRPYRNPGVAWTSAAKRDAVIVIDGIEARISSRSPFFRTLQQIAVYENSVSIVSPRLQSAVRSEALTTIAADVQMQLRTLQQYRQPGKVPEPAVHSEPSLLADELVRAL
jgi:M6 family metalloprotease-like protein